MHTPGPWEVKGRYYGQQFRAETIEPNICELSSSLPPDEVTANARLIAAAPDLLSALKNLTEWGRTHTSPRDANSPHTLLIAACEAIDKAEGRTA